MTCDISKTQALNQNELENLTKNILNISFNKRKYNQKNYLWWLCKEVLIGIYVSANNNLSIEKPEPQEKRQSVRDSYKQILYKYALYNESKRLEGQICCFVEKLRYPVLIASHIKPFAQCNEKEQFDVENGLLLSKNIDYLFDKGWISFDDVGRLLCAKNLDINLKKILSEKVLDKKFLSIKRLEYIKYHRKHIFNNFNTYKF